MFGRFKQCQSVPHRRLAGVVCLVAMLAGGAFASVRAFGADDAGDAETRQRQARMLAQIEAKRRELSERRRSNNLRVFRDSGGVATLTNRPSKFRGREGYVEVALSYSPIAVPAKYRKRGPASRFSGDDIAAIIRHYANEYKLDESLVYAVIRAESDMQHDAVSSAGACGLMQLMPGTAADMSVDNIFDPAENIAGGTQYLSKLMELFNGNTKLALAGYNAGPGTVKRYGGIPPYRETQDYVRKVLRFEQEFRKGWSRSAYLARKSAQHGTFSPPRNGRRYVVHFHSGSSQEADDVVEHSHYYNIRVGKVHKAIPKRLVAKIEETA